MKYKIPIAKKMALTVARYLDSCRALMNLISWSWRGEAMIALYNSKLAAIFLGNINSPQGKGDREQPRLMFTFGDVGRKRPLKR